MCDEINLRVAFLFQCRLIFYMNQFQLFVIIDQSRAWTSDKNQAIYYTAQLLCLFQSPSIKKSCGGLFL